MASRFLSIAEFRKTVAAFQSGTALIVDGGGRAVDPRAYAGDLGELIEQVKAFAGAPKSVAIREGARAKDRMLENNFEGDLRALIKASFHPVSFEKLTATLTLHTSTNLLAEIVGKLSALYDEHPRRYLAVEIEDPEAPEAADTTRPPAGSVDDLASRELAPPVGDPTDEGDPELEALLSYLGVDDEDPDDSFEEIAKSSDLDVHLQRVEKLARAHCCVWVRPQVVYDKDSTGSEALDSGRLSFVVYTPGSAGVLMDPDNPSEPRAFFYFSEELSEGKIVEVTNVFTSSAFVKLDNQFRPMGPALLNPLGRLPVAKFEIDIPINGYFCAGVGDDLYRATLEVCLLKTIQNQRAKDTGFKQIILQGDPKGFPADQVMGGVLPLVLGEGNTASVLDLQPALEEWTNLVTSRVKDLQAKYGIVVETESGGGGPESGYAKRLKLAGMIRENRRTRPHFLRAEKDLFELIARMLELRPIPALPVPPAGDLVIDYVEISIDQSPKEQSEIDARELTMGTANVLEILGRKNPDLDEPELARLAYRNMRINEALSSARGERLIDFLSLGAKPDANAKDTNGPGGAGPQDQPADGPPPQG